MEDWVGLFRHCIEGFIITYCRLLTMVVASNVKFRSHYARTRGSVVWTSRRYRQQCIWSQIQCRNNRPVFEQLKGRVSRGVSRTLKQVLQTGAEFGRVRIEAPRLSAEGAWIEAPKAPRGIGFAIFLLKTACFGAFWCTKCASHAYAYTATLIWLISTVA